MWAIIYLVLAVLIILGTIGATITAWKERREHDAVVRDYERDRAAYEQERANGTSGGLRGFRNPPEAPRGSRPPSALAVAAAGAAVLAVVSVLFSWTVVPTRTVAINTAFGQYQRTLDPGFHVVPPYSDTEEFTTRLQPIDINLPDTEEADGDSKHAVPIPFAGGGRGWAELQASWQINDNTDSTGAYALWLKFKGFDSVRDDLVYPTMRDTFRNVASEYRPVDALASQQKISDETIKRANVALAKYGVVVDRLSILGLPLDAKTQEALDRINTSDANISNAQKEQDRAKIDAETARIRTESGVLTPVGNQRFCLDMMNAWKVEVNGPLPAGFSCIGGLNATPTLSLNPTK